MKDSEKVKDYHENHTCTLRMDVKEKKWKKGNNV